MEVSGHIPEGATGMRENSGENQLKRGEKIVSLTDEQLDMLIKCYMAINCEYGELYYQEHEKAKRYHHLRKFPSPVEWQPATLPPLNKPQKEMLLGPTKTVKSMKYYCYSRVHGRQTKLRTVECEMEYM